MLLLMHLGTGICFCLIIIEMIMMKNEKPHSASSPSFVHLFVFILRTENSLLGVILLLLHLLCVELHATCIYLLHAWTTSLLGLE
jgi:hypothetical protein